MSVINTYIITVIMLVLKRTEWWGRQQEIETPITLGQWILLWKVQETYQSLYTHTPMCPVAVFRVCHCSQVLFSIIPLAYNKQFSCLGLHIRSMSYISRRVQSRYIRRSYPVESQAKRSTINHGLFLASSYHRSINPIQGCYGHILFRMAVESLTKLRIILRASSSLTLVVLLLFLP